MEEQNGQLDEETKSVLEKIGEDFQKVVWISSTKQEDGKYSIRIQKENKPVEIITFADQERRDIVYSMLSQFKVRPRRGLRLSKKSKRADVGL